MFVVLYNILKLKLKMLRISAPRTGNERVNYFLVFHWKNEVTLILTVLFIY